MKKQIQINKCKHHFVITHVKIKTWFTSYEIPVLICDKCGMEQCENKNKHLVVSIGNIEIYKI